MKTSPPGVSFICRCEGFRAEPYADIAGHLTIGYGHLIRLGEHFPVAISKLEGQEILKRDLEEAETYVTENCTTAPTQAQFDALVSFTFNLGGGVFKRSDLLTYHNQSDFLHAARAFTEYMSAGGVPNKELLLRRFAEATAYLT